MTTLRRLLFVITYFINIKRWCPEREIDAASAIGRQADHIQFSGAVSSAPTGDMSSGMGKPYEGEVGMGIRLAHDCVR
jgi:hypothetical protein